MFIYIASEIVHLQSQMAHMTCKPIHIKERMENNEEAKDGYITCFFVCFFYMNKVIWNIMLKAEKNWWWRKCEHNNVWFPHPLSFLHLTCWPWQIHPCKYTYYWHPGWRTCRIYVSWMKRKSTQHWEQFSIELSRGGSQSLKVTERKRKKKTASEYKLEEIYVRCRGKSNYGM